MKRVAYFIPDFESTTIQPVCSLKECFDPPAVRPKQNHGYLPVNFHMLSLEKTVVSNRYNYLFQGGKRAVTDVSY
jgi:hypothetical protein